MDEARIESMIQELWELLQQGFSTLEHRLSALPPEHDQDAALRMLTERDLAEMLRLSPRHLRRMELSGEIPRAIRIGSSKRWRADEVERWLSDKAESVARDPLDRRQR